MNDQNYHFVFGRKMHSHQNQIDLFIFADTSDMRHMFLNFAERLFITEIEYQNIQINDFVVHYKRTLL